MQFVTRGLQTPTSRDPWLVAYKTLGFWCGRSVFSRFASSAQHGHNIKQLFRQLAAALPGQDEAGAVPTIPTRVSMSRHFKVDPLSLVMGIVLNPSDIHISTDVRNIR